MRKCLLLLLFATTAYGANWPGHPILKAVRIKGPSPVIDGNLDDPAWQQAPEFTDFSQHDPDDTKPATMKTSVRILYDDNAIYFGAKMYDTGRPNTLLLRRDTFGDFDFLSINLDTQHDRLSGNAFTVSPAGEQGDTVLYNDIGEDPSWDGVWDSATKVVPDGWIAEVRIPFSQLRFQDKPVQVWGINITRKTVRNNETDRVVNTPKGQTGFVAHFADLVGIEGVHRGRPLEVVPYTVGRTDLRSGLAGDPLVGPHDSNMDGGVDLKYGLTSSLTLTGTINPDFGQVEVDPAVVNLTQFETFYPEKRPFFIEGLQIFNFATSPAPSHFNFFNTPTMFYTRRIGRAPEEVLDADFVDAPSSTRILGAAKLTGKLPAGWTVGAIDALTDRETARFVSDGIFGRQQVEPMTNYFVSRATKEFGPNSRVGFLLTDVERQFGSDAAEVSTSAAALPRGGAAPWSPGKWTTGKWSTGFSRSLDIGEEDQGPAEAGAPFDGSFSGGSFAGAPLRDTLRRSALTGGIDGYSRFGNNGSWIFEGSGYATDVRGSADAIELTQEAPQRYYQRPDATSFHVDPNATSLTGWGGTAMVSKADGLWRPVVQVQMYSPGFETNDIGFMQRADIISPSAIMQYVNQTVTSRWREKDMFIGLWQNRNFDGDSLDHGLFFEAFGTLANYWTPSVTIIATPAGYDDRLTRGGPLAKAAPFASVDASITTDTRKNFSAQFTGHADGGSDGSYTRNIGVTLTAKPRPNLQLSVAPTLSHGHNTTQYVTAFADATATQTYGQRYVFATLDQRSFEFDMRADWTITSRLSFQLYLQPFIASGDYHDYRSLVAARTRDYAATAPPPFDPDFNLRSLRGNAVVRWEFRPGSALYVAWNENRADTEPFGDLRFRRDFSAIPSAPSHDVFLVKVSYWLPL
ncbi:MAG TPA: DUF5916 domain-containing protein [Thermoanaerobaculia bacterium]|nr:DUF5916 domain-containing protein [Thermoanaerobaculia bacterium]